MNIGIDVGGSHIGLGIVNNNGEILVKAEKDYVTTQRDMSKVVVNTIIELMYEVIENGKIKKEEIKKIGIAFPGTVSNGIVVKAENLGIQNFEIVDILKKEYNGEILLQNDAKCAAMAEKKFGSLKKYNDSLFLILGTGVGGAVFLQGELLMPKRYSGFEVGHMVIEKNGVECNCGRKGCFEVYGSMKRLKEKIKDEFSLSSIHGKEIKEFMIKNKENERLKEILDTYIENLTIGMANLINIFEPEAISIGGSFAHYKDILLEKLENKLLEKKGLYNKEEIPQIVMAKLKNDAGIIGAAMQS